MKVTLLFLFLIVSATARENPFFPSDGEKDLPYTSNEKDPIERLKKASVTLPSTARIIKQITIEYENLDASRATKTLELDNSIDWHLPVFISQNYDDSKPCEKEKLTTKNQQKNTQYKLVATIGKTKLLSFENKMRIETKDKLMRNFLLAQPHRIVMDFQSPSVVKGFKKVLKDSVFTKVRVGNHEGYYRVVIELDGYYRYKLDKHTKGCLITLQ
jgi:hypothetical protein